MLLQKQLRAFGAEIFAGLPIGAAFCAALVLFALTLVPVPERSTGSEKISAVRSATYLTEERVAVRIGRRESLQGLLHRVGVRASSVQELLRKVHSAVDLRKIPRDQTFNVILDSRVRDVRAVEFVLQDHLVRVSDGLSGWSVEKQELAHVAGATNITIRVTDNFGESAVRAGVTLAQVARLQRIFSAEVDLMTDLRAGDEVSLVLPEKRYLDGHVIQGRIAAARVVHGGRSVDAYGFSSGAGALQYYDADGNLLPRAFLAAPLKFERISSTFDLARADPATGVRRPHEAIDFQAAQGTPVVSVGSGTVEFAGVRGDYGLMVEIKHPGGYASTYAHLSLIADGIEAGRRVNAGETIGAVGQTGHATGPHLHFEFARDGEKLDYLAIKLPSAESLSGFRLLQFKREQALWLSALRGAAVRIVQTPVSTWQ
jgi:murein DD-endopeptidase MepM/ murein hydrolase activator NlpD